MPLVAWSPLVSVFINGKRVDLSGNTFNVFDLLTEVRAELQQLQQLGAALPTLTAASRSALIEAAAKMDAGPGTVLPLSAPLSL